MSILEKLRQPAPDFLSQKLNTFLFILFVLLFAVFFIIIYHPISFHKTVGILPHWSERVYTAVTVGIGFITLVVSRIMLHHHLQRGKMPLGGYLIWIVGEFLFFSLFLSTLVYCVNEHPSVSFVRLWVRIFFNITGILSVPYLLFAMRMVLNERNIQIKHLNMLIAQRQNDVVVTQGDTINFYDKGGRLAFATRRSQVLYVESSDNYTNVYYLSEDNKVEQVILHNTMKQLEQLYERWGLLRCHRGYMVNIDNVKLLRREKDGFVLELAYVDRPIPVSKSYSDRIVQQFATPK